MVPVERGSAGPLEKRPETPQVKLREIIGFFFYSLVGTDPLIPFLSYACLSLLIPCLSPLYPLHPLRVGNWFHEPLRPTPRTPPFFSNTRHLSQDLPRSSHNRSSIVHATLATTSVRPLCWRWSSPWSSPPQTETPLTSLVPHQHTSIVARAAQVVPPQRARAII